jgi:hypothetical protein
MGLGASMLWLTVNLGSAGCELAPVLTGADDEAKGKGDGQRCREDDECASGFCTTEELCAHSACDCPGNTCGSSGKVTEPCADHWVCTDADSIFDGVEEFFGGHARKDKGYCQPLCQPDCPEHYYCAGMFCVPQVGWANPVPSIVWDGAADGMSNNTSAMENVDFAEGKSVHLEASAMSPTDVPISTFSWQRVTSRGEYDTVEGPALDLMLDPDLSFVRAELTVTDERSRSSFLTVTFNACLGAGETCGYGGGGCCNGCDRTLDQCQ